MPGGGKLTCTLQKGRGTRQGDVSGTLRAVSMQASHFLRTSKRWRQWVRSLAVEQIMEAKGRRHGRSVLGRRPVCCTAASTRSELKVSRLRCSQCARWTALSALHEVSATRLVHSRACRTPQAA